MNPSSVSPLTPPPMLASLVAGYNWSCDSTGCSGADVFHLHAEGKPGMYLKRASRAGDHSLHPEHQRLEWLAGRLPVPRVICFAHDDEAEYLLISEVVGRPSHSFHGPGDQRRQGIEQTIHLLADGLRTIHSLPVSSCPFSHSIETEITAAEQRMNAGLVDESDFDDARLGLSAGELFDELLRTTPIDEDRVFTHGDYCLPNIIVAGEEIAGFIDVGRAGIGDRWRDLALAARSIRYNWGDGWEQVFLDAYGLERVDRKKMEFFLLLDEFF